MTKKTPTAKRGSGGFVPLAPPNVSVIDGCSEVALQPPDGQWLGGTSLAAAEVSPSHSHECRDLLRLAAAVLQAKSAALCLTLNGVSRVIHAVGSLPLYRSFPACLPWSPNSTMGDMLVIADATKEDSVPKVLFENNCAIGFFLRMPILITADFCLTLIVTDEEPKDAPNDNQLALIANVVTMILHSFQPLEKYFLRQPGLSTIPVGLQELIAGVATSGKMIVLLDDKFAVKASSVCAAALPGHVISSVFGQPASATRLAISGSLAFFLQQAVLKGVSTAAFELVTAPEHGSDSQYELTVRATPVVPVGQSATYLYVNIKKFVEVRAPTRQPLARSAAGETLSRPETEPVAQLLFDTLVPRRSVRVRDGVNYMSLRAWRQPLKDFQVRALKALKDNPGAIFTDRIGAEIADEVISLLGHGALDVVVPMSCGHSKGVKCLSVEIGRSVARALRLPLVQCFERQMLPGSSHPKQSKNKPPLRLKMLVGGSVLLVDDVATSGLHLAEATSLLRPHCKMVLPVAWIGGETTGDDD